MKFMDAFCGKLDEVQCPYQRATDSKGQEMISIGLSGDHFSGLQYFLLFDNDTSAQIRCYICKFPPDKNLSALQIVNQLNRRYRWIKFFVESSGAVGATADIKATEDTAAEILFHILCRMNGIIDDAYPTLMRVIYSDIERTC